VNRVAELLNMQGLALSRSKVLLLGIAYKKNVGDTRESPAIEIANMLKARGATVRGFDPFVDKLPKEAGDLEMLGKLDEDALRSFDCVVLTTDHDQFDYEWIADNVRLVFDTRNAFRNVDKPHVYRLGTPLRAETVSQVANA
jgi:UDP-N-acetyl-D-glucosamine dehydrogenase